MSVTEGVTPEDSVAEPVWVEVVTGPSAGTKKRLDRGTLFVGSGPESDLMLDDRAVSRRHVSFELLSGRVRVRDLGSRNGTAYLGARVAEAMVPLGASVTVGRSTLAIRAIAHHGLEPSPLANFDELLGQSVVMRQVFSKLEKLAPSDATVLFVGENGTGKEAAARALHRRSPRANKPFVVFECAAASPELFESRLFGHVRGAFTGAERDQPGLIDSAGDGTVLLDEVGALPLELQPRLLRLLESRDYLRVGDSVRRKTPARLLASTQRDLSMAVREGTYREDLYYRLAVAEIVLPPLRERREDIPMLVAHFAKQLRGIGMQCSAATLEALQLEAWPGNVRELRNAVTRALALGEWKTPLAVEAPTTFQEARHKVLDAFEREYIRALLERHEGNVSAAAREAGLARSAFYRLLGRHQLGSEPS